MNSNSVVLNQTLRSVAFDLELQYLLMSFCKWVNIVQLLYPVSNESVSRQWRPWSGCASAQSAIWAFAVHICLRTLFRMAWNIYGWFFKLFSLTNRFLNIHCVLYTLCCLERERERDFITLNGLFNCGIKQCKYKTCLAIFYLYLPSFVICPD